MNYHVLEKARLALDHYLYLMTGEAHRISVNVEPGTFAVADTDLDDAYRIDVREAAGTIAASNPRAALIAVYHLLRENGCAFVRPGKASERVPRRKSDEISARLEITAAHRFRGLCIEGSCNLEDTVDLLEWMPKVGMDCYFMQFREGYNFFQRWYECEANPEMTPWEFNLNVCRSIVPKIACAAHENGLMYHAVGHGFTCECFGVTALGWIAVDQWPEQYADVLAMRNGVRDMAENIPLISALCYSNPKIQQMITNSAADYIAQHPEYDYVHFWLDDGNNNKCECKDCRDTRPADFYIQMLNRLDARLTEKHVDTKIVFLSYHELLWPPEKEKINNPGRFTFMFAPIQRSFRQPLFHNVCPEAMKPYTLNHQPFPENNGQMAAYLQAWNHYRTASGLQPEESFDFDYYCNDFDDPGQFSQARILYDDIRGLKESGLNGLINCQAQRSFSSAALPMYVMARTLLQPDLPFDRIADEFFYGAFGEDWRPYRRMWEKLTDASEVLRDPQSSDFSELEQTLRQSLPNEECKDLTTSHSRKLMRFSMELYQQLAEMTRQSRLGNQNKAKRTRYAIDRMTSLRECEYSQEFDRKYFSEAEDRLIKP